MPLSAAEISSRYLPALSEMSMSFCIPTHSIHHENLLADDDEHEDFLLDDSLSTPLPPTRHRTSPLKSPSRVNARSNGSISPSASTHPVRLVMSPTQLRPIAEGGQQCTPPRDASCREFKENEEDHADLQPRSGKKNISYAERWRSTAHGDASSSQPESTTKVGVESLLVEEYNHVKEGATSRTQVSEGAKFASTRSVASECITTSRTRKNRERAPPPLAAANVTANSEAVSAVLKRHGQETKQKAPESRKTRSRNMQTSSQQHKHEDPQMIDDRPGSTVIEDSFTALPVGGIAGRLIMYGQKIMEQPVPGGLSNVFNKEEHEIVQPRLNLTLAQFSGATSSHYTLRKIDHDSPPSLNILSNGSGAKVAEEKSTTRLGTSHSSSAAPSLKRSASPVDDQHHASQRRKRLRPSQPEHAKPVAPRPQSKNNRSRQVRRSSKKTNSRKGTKSSGTKDLVSSTAASNTTYGCVKINSSAGDASQLQAGTRSDLVIEDTVAPNSSSSLSNTDPTKPIGSVFQVNTTSIEARKTSRMEGQKVPDATPRNGKSQYKEANSDGKIQSRLHHNSKHEALLLTRKEHIAPTVPRAFEWNTDLRVKQRRVFDEKMKEKERLMQAAEGERRRLKELEEEEERKEARKRTVIKAHPVPDWYQGVPKKDSSGSGRIR